MWLSFSAHNLGVDRVSTRCGESWQTFRVLNFANNDLISCVGWGGRWVEGGREGGRAHFSEQL